MGYNIIFLPDNFILTYESKEGAIRAIDSILTAIAKVSLLNILNDMQMEVVGDTFEPKSPFHSKWTIPDYFINLALSKYNIKLERRK